MTAKNYSWYNSGVSGQTVSDFSANAATEIDSNYRSALRRNVCVVWGGVNDANAGASAATIYDRLKTYWAARRAAGFKIVACTEIDAQDAGRNAVGWHSTLWPALNTLIKSDATLYDSLVDLGADSRLQNALDTTYFNADKVHLTDTGYGVVAALVAAQVSAL
jgi:lysophospholipase L1-like esterase